MIAAVLSRLGTHHALVVHGDGGLDELSLTGESHVHEVKDGAIHEYFVSPEELGLATAPLEAVKGGTPEENASKLRSVLAGERGPLRDIVALNAAAALVAADIAPDLKAGVQLAAETIDSGAAKARLETFLRVTGDSDKGSRDIRNQMTQRTETILDRIVEHKRGELAAASRDAAR
jgi:anthranilate phosphoribosyltransferase